MRPKDIALFCNIFFSCHLFRQIAAAEEVQQYPEPGKHNLFAANLFHNIVESKSSENILFSPVYIEKALTILFSAADGKTEKDLRHILRLGAEDSTLAVKANFLEFLQTLIKPNKETKLSSQSELYAADVIYVSDKLKISKDFKDKIDDYSNVFIENVNFTTGKLTSDKFNNILAKCTQDKIQNLLQEDEINSLLNIIYGSGLYFKGKWKYSFNEKYTKKSDFHCSETEKQKIDMMHMKGMFNYVDLPELEGSALELPYNSPDLTMLILLPYKIDGLKKFEAKLRDLKFNYILSRLAPKEVCAYIPKFQIEHKMDLQPVLEKMGLPIIFSEKAAFPAMLDSAGHRISVFKQKALFEIDELGSQAAAAEPAAAEAASDCSKEYTSFNVDRPFIFVVRSPTAAYFAGHVAKF